MSKAGRLGLIALALVVLAVAFVVVSPGGDEDDGVTSTPAGQTAEEPTATARSALPPPPDGPDPARIELRDHLPTGGAQTIEVERGDRVTIVVRSDAPDEVHVHGYDVEAAPEPGKPARLSFDADIEGVFEIESHEAEHAGEDPLIARLVVKPS
jgi:FtsP/CotA-like multicopper oxidase with cupredoxin domain